MSLMDDARNELNYRTKGREARLERLAAAGIPTDHTALAAWLRDAEDAAHTGLYHACTVRIANGCDADLPKAGPFGCRVTRVAIKARLVHAGDEEVPGEIPSEDYYSVMGGSVGTGYIGPTCVTCDAAASAQEAEEMVRQRLLRSGDCFETRAEAVAACERMLAVRAARLSNPTQAR